MGSERWGVQFANGAFAPVDSREDAVKRAALSRRAVAVLRIEGDLPPGSVVLSAAEVEQVREEAVREAIAGMLNLVVQGNVQVRANGYGAWLVPSVRNSPASISTHEITVDEVLALLTEGQS